MTRLRTRLLLPALLAACAAGGASAPPSAAQSGDTSAVAVNTRDGSTLFRFAFSVRQILGDVVDQSNVAVAYASCNECQTVAISFQILLVSGSPDQVTPTNLALALNENCTDCQTLAAAYQFVFGNGQELRFTAEGLRRIADVRRRFQALRREGLSLAEIQARADELADELRQVLADEVTTRGSGDGEDDQTGEPAATPAGEASPTATATPGATETPSPSPTAAAPTPSPTATPTPTPTPTTTATATPSPAPADDGTGAP